MCATERKRKATFLCWLSAALFVSWAHLALAGKPARRLSQFHHTAWTAEDGAPLDQRALAQTDDGFLWIGSSSGLYRFDGVRFEKVQPRGDQMPSVAVNSLLAMPGGDLWIGYKHGGVARLRDDHLSDMSAGFMPGGTVKLARGPEDVVYATTNGTGYPQLGRFVDGRWQRLDSELGLANSGPRGIEVMAILGARSGVLWVEIDDRLFFLRPGAKRFTSTGQRMNGTWLAEDNEGRIWSTVRWANDPAGWNVRLPRFDTDPAARPVAGLYSPSSTQGDLMLVAARDGSLWGSTPRGVVRLEAGSADHRWELFSSRDGLSSDLAGPVFEDREGNIWVGTNLGLDRFRAAELVAAEGIPRTSTLGLWAAPATEGGVYVATGDRLYRAHAGGPADVIAERNQRTAFLHTDHRGVLWFGGEDRLQRLQDGRLQRVNLPAEAKGDPVYITESTAGEMWVSIWANGVFRQDKAEWKRVEVPSDPWRPAPDQVFIDREDGVWMIFRGVLSRFEHGILRQMGQDDGLSIGRVQTLANGSRGLIAAGDHGIARFDGQRFQSLLATRIPELGGASGVVQTKAGDTWINTINGVVHVRTNLLDHAFDHADASLPRRVFDLSDGLPGIAQLDNNTPSSIEAADGTIWFLTNHGVVWIDPASRLQNDLPPPVRIRSIAVGGHSYPAQAGLRLPAGSDDIEFDYTALSLSAPERVRFKYRLEGVDNDWIDPGVRRQAFYTNLGPGPYRFHVIAANEDGVWNEAGATLDFSITPTFFQTSWFYVLCGLATAGLLWSIYLLRLRSLTAGMHEQMKVRLVERDRIARELHDTLLQGFQGLVLKFQAIAEGIPKATASRHSLEEALDRADRVLVEGRERIVSLRTADRTLNLADSIDDVLQQIDADAGMQVRRTEEGKARPVTPLATAEIREIVQEALGNAYRHANCQTFEVRVIYRPKELELVIRDDGIGIRPELLDGRTKPGHFGLTGMRERAESLRGRLEIHSEDGGGCTITLCVPGRIAYR